MSLSLSPQPPMSTLFPYTTLFRSWDRHSGLSRLKHILPDEPRAHLADARIARLADDSEARIAEVSIRIHKLRSEEHTSELQSPMYLVCRLLLEKKKHKTKSM